MTQIKDIAITKTVASDGDWLILQSEGGETYRIQKQNLIIDNVDFSTVPEISELSDYDYVLVQTTSGTRKINKDALNQKTYLKWLLTETAGTTANDNSGNSRNGTFSDCILSSDGVFLNGTSSIIYANASNAQMTPLAVRLEFKTTGISNAGLWEFRDTQNSFGGTYTPGLRLTSAGKLWVYGYPNSSGTSTDSYNDGNWHTAVVVCDSSRIRLFVDKNKVIDIAGSAQVGFTGYFSIGYGKNYGYLNGNVRNFQIWGQTLSDPQGIGLS